MRKIIHSMKDYLENKKNKIFVKIIIYKVLIILIITIIIKSKKLNKIK